MNRTKWERFKFYVLIILMCTGMLQVGILWNYQSHGFPYYFFSGFLQNKESLNNSVDKDKKEFFTPYRIIVSEGFVGSHWLIDKNDSLYDKLFLEAEPYIDEILGNSKIKSKQVRPLSEDSLGELAIKPSIVYEFKTGISKKLLAMFRDIKDISDTEISSIKKIIILPLQAGENDNLCTVEIVDEQDGKIYEYEMPFKENGREYYENLLDDMDKNNELKSYYVFSELKMAIPGLPIGGDVLVAATESSKYNTYSNISYTAPEGFEIKNPENDDEIMDLADRVLHNEKHNYFPSVSIYGAAIFKNSTGVYKIHKDGLLEYSYLPSSQEVIEKGDVTEAFTRVLTFMKAKRDLVKGAELFLSGIEEDKKDKYIFKFGYSVGGIPVLFETGDNESKSLDDAVVIEATADKILNCRWIFKDFTVGQKDEYSEDFYGLLQNLDIKDGTQGENKRLYIKNIGVCYKVTVAQGKNIEPSWLIESEGNKRYAVNFRKRR